MHTEAVRLAAALSAGHDQRVDPAWRVAKRGIRRDHQAARGAQGRTVPAHDRDLVAARGVSFGLDQRSGAGEHLERTGNIEALHAGVGQYHDLSRL